MREKTGRSSCLTRTESADMEFPSPAMNYRESRLSLDCYCKTERPGVFLFRSGRTSFCEGIRQGSLLIVDFGGTPVDGSLVLCVVEEQFMLMRLRLYPKRSLQELDKLDQIRAFQKTTRKGWRSGGVSRT